MPKIKVNGISLNYLIDGPSNAPTIMFSNSLASNLTMWDLQTRVMVNHGFKVVRYDSRGHGGSDVPDGPYNIEMLAEDASQIIEKLQLGSVHFCGLSKGGMVAQMMGSHHADKIKSLTIADSAAFMPLKETWDQRISAVKQGGLQAVVDGTIERWLTESGRERLPEQVVLIREMILTTPPNGFIACSEAIKAMDMRSTNQSITVPTLVICGEDDTGTTPAQAAEIADAIKGGVLKLIPKAAHLANIEQPDIFNRLLLDHIETCK